MYIEMPFSDCISASVDWYVHIYTCAYQSTDAIRKRHLYIHISRLMQSENGILLLFYIFLSHENERKKKEKKGGVGCKKGGCCVLSTSTCVWNYPLPLSFQTCYLVSFDIIVGLFVHMRLWHWITSIFQTCCTCLHIRV